MMMIVEEIKFRDRYSESLCLGSFADFVVGIMLYNARYIGLVVERILHNS